jgi:radical SAM enzyme (TIGR01210 family)
MSRYEHDLDKACRTVLEQFRIDRSDILLALVFGSRARRQELSTSDFDIIFIIQPNAACPGFVYRRLKFGDSTIDANIIEPASLDRLCWNETGWAYRLYRARRIPGFTKIPRDLADAWLQRNDALIRHPLACRRRLLWHLADCRALLRNAHRLQTEPLELTTLPVLSTYLMIEALFQVPLIHLNLLGLVPFEANDPWSSALAAGSPLEIRAIDEYNAILETIIHSALYSDLAFDGRFAHNLKHIRDRCRNAVIKRLGYAFGDGFGKALKEKAKVDERLLSSFAEILSGVHAAEKELIEALTTWTGKVLGQSRELATRAGRRVAITRTKRVVPGTRLIDYCFETARLKIILPTGGCRVPTCTFCMLPNLARAKESIDRVIEATVEATGKGPVRHVSIYTDGSFFDEREVAVTERLAIADKVRQWGATELLVESLPRFISPGAIDEMNRNLGPRCRLRIGVGLQSTDPLVRRHITGTPITQSELIWLLTLRGKPSFTFRFYLLANKPMMSAAEDLHDLQRSLDLLDRCLMPEDTVTINPLLPTRGTLVEQLEAARYWRPLSSAAAVNLFRRLQAKPHGYSLEFGPITGATCTDRGPITEVEDAFGGVVTARTRCDGALIDMALVPWSLFGGYRNRYRWARTGGYLVVATERLSG